MEAALDRSETRHQIAFAAWLRRTGRDRPRIGAARPGVRRKSNYQRRYFLRRLDKGGAEHLGSTVLEQGQHEACGDRHWRRPGRRKKGGRYYESREYARRSVRPDDRLRRKILGAAMDIAPIIKRILEKQGVQALPEGNVWHDLTWRSLPSWVSQMTNGESPKLWRVQAAET